MNRKDLIVEQDAEHDTEHTRNKGLKLMQTPV